MKKISKRLLSVLLSALLVMTSLPLFAFTAFAADKSALESAMAAYEAKMDGNFYTNMKAAYDAYVAAAEVYADENATDAQISAAASTLNYETGEMGEFSGHVANGPVHYGTTDEDPSPERYAGILWADGTGTTAYDTNQGGKAETSTLGITYGAYFYFYYPTNTVLMYDGRTTPIMPIMMGAIDRDSNYNLHPCYVGTYSDDFKLFDYWYGYDDNFVWPATKDWLIGYNASTDVGMDDAVEIDNTSTIRSFMNYLRYAGTPTNTLTTINGMTFYEQHNMSVVGVTTHTDENKDLTMTIPVRIINYKKLLDKLGEVGGRYNTVLDKVNDYKEGGLSQLIDALDQAITDPNSFFTTSNGYQACANWIDKSITDLSNITITMDPAAAQSIEGAQDVLDAFETKVNSGKYYLNTANVYKLYCRLHACVDAYEYGDGTSAAIGEASEALNTAINSMVEFTPYTPSGTVKMQDDSTAVSDSAYVSGLIGNYTASTSTMGYDSLGGSGTSPGGVYAFVNSPTSVVALYDGSTPIRIPLMTAWHNNMGFTIGTGNRRMMNAVYPIVYNDGNYTPADNADFGLTQVWNGHTNDSWNSNMSGTPNNVVFKWSSSHDSPAYSGTLAGYSQATYNAATTNGAYNENTNWQGQRSSSIFAYWNFMQYKGGASGFTNGIKTAKVNFWGMSKWPKAAIDTEGRHWFGSTSSPVTTVTIIDYKTPIDTFKANWDAKMATFAAGNYDEGGYAAVFEAMDAFTGYNGFASATTAANAATVASTLNSLAAATGSATGTANGPEYQALRDKIEWYPSAEKYVTGMSDPTYWTAESWQDLIDAIDAAEAIMTALPSNNAYYYLNPTAAQNAATAIQTAYDNLQQAGTMVDPAVTAYNTFIAALQDDKYTANSLKAAEAIVDAIQTNWYTYTEGTRVPIENEAAINAEATAFTNAYNALVEDEDFDSDSYYTYVSDAKAKKADPDAFDVAAMNTAIETLENAPFEAVTFNILNRDVRGIVADANTAVSDAAQATVSFQKKQYTITVTDPSATITANGVAVTSGETLVDYGASIVVTTGSKADYTYDYVSATANTNGGHFKKYVGTLTSFEFTLVGNTTVEVASPTDTNKVKVTYRTSCIIDGDEALGYDAYVEYVNSGSTIDVTNIKKPYYAFYIYDKCDQNGDTVTEDTIVTLNYTQRQLDRPSYIIHNLGDEEEGVPYDELLTFDDPDVVAYVLADEDADLYYWNVIDKLNTKTKRKNYPGNTSNYDETVKYTLIAKGSEFSFRAREEMYLIAITEDFLPVLEQGNHIRKFDDKLNPGTEVDASIVTVDPFVTSDGSIFAYSTFALPEGATYKEAGVLIRYNKTGNALDADRALDFNNVGTSASGEKMARLKATKLNPEQTNCFTTNIHLKTSTFKAEYVAYVSYTDANGLHTVFSDAVSVD